MLTAILGYHLLVKGLPCIGGHLTGEDRQNMDPVSMEPHFEPDPYEGPSALWTPCDGPGL